MSLILDVTQLAEWPGKLTGIPRVMHELTERFTETSDCQLVIWDSASKEFKPLSSRELCERRTEEASGTPIKPPSNARRLVRAIETRSALVGRTRRRLQASVAKNGQQTAPISTPGTSISSNDTLVVFWGSWGDENYIDVLLKVHAAGTKLIQFAYDMLPLVTPQFSGHATDALNRYASAIYPNCSLLLSISEHTKRDVSEWLKTKRLAVPKIVVFRLGDDFMASAPTPPTDAVFHDAGLAGSDFLLVVGTVEARKNHTLLYYTYKLARQRDIRLPKLVIVGRRGWLTDDIYTLITTDPDTKEMFVMLQSANDNELTWLYEHCMFTVYPSFYEGWGLPIAESLYRGVPCIASNTSSMPEIAGNLINYFSPVSTEECLNEIVRLLAPKELAYARQQVKKYKPTSWDDTFMTISSCIKKETSL